MIGEIALYPQEASSAAQQVDLLFLFMVALCSAVGLLVAFLMIFFCIYYRRRPSDSGNPPETHSSDLLEWSWTLTPLVIFLFVFVWGAKVYFGAYRAGQRAHRLRRGKTMDVEVPAS